MIRLVGADIDLTSTGYLVIRWCGLAHLVRLTDTEHDVFLALERDRRAVETEQAARTERTARSREVILRKIRKMAI
jgi:hypothetical protein